MQANRGKRVIVLRSILLILLMAGLTFMLIYKSQIEWEDDTKVLYTLMSAHKQKDYVILSKDNPVVIQDFVCNVPELKRIKIQGVAKDIDESATLNVQITGLDSGNVYYSTESKLTEFYSSKLKNKVYKLKKMPKNTEGLIMRLYISLQTEGDTIVKFTDNNKPGTVISFNGDANNHTNIINQMQYSQISVLKSFYYFIFGWFVLTFLLIFYLLIIRKCKCEQWFPVVAMMMGLAVQWIVPVYGVPDEPWHMDTAYQLSNTIMGVDDEPQEGTLLKRECDIITSDLLANDVESNSYYQLVCNSFDIPDNTELKRVSYVDSGNQVPDLVYLPAAVGICIGRLFGLSGMMTYQLSRISALIVYVILAWMAIRIIPFCNSMLAMIATSMIALQQAASASYDAMINGVLLLFVSLCLRLSYGNDGKHNKQYFALTALSAAFISVVKGGVYIPLLLILVLFIYRKRKARTQRKNANYKGIAAIIISIIVLAGLMFWKFYPFFSIMFEGGDLKGGERYTVSYVLKHPLAILYMCWRTIIKNGEKYLRGMFGGVLGWHNIEISWMFILPIIIGLVMLVNVEYERPPRNMSYKVVSIGVSLLVVALIMLAMLFAETKVGRATIWGIQGRYFVPVLPLMLSAMSSSSITVKREKASRIILIIIISEIIALLQVVVNII